MDSLNDDQPVIVNLNEHLVFESLQQQKNTLSQAMLNTAPLVLKADQVTQVDTASLQLLYAFIKAMNAKHQPWTWSSPSKELQQIAKLLGMSELLELPKVE